LAAATDGWAQEAAWPKVQQMLAGTRDIVVLDGAEPAPRRDPRGGQPSPGDWLVQTLLSDPEGLNPYTSSDASASAVRGYILEPLLYPGDEPPYALKGLLATDYPRISADRLTYTFELRAGARFSDGHPLDVEDVLFSMKVIQNPRVLAPHLRNYYAAVQDARIDGDRRITFACDRPYFLNDLILGSFAVLPRHYYDPEGLLEPVPLRSLIDGSWEQGPHAERVRRFAEEFNQGYNRRILGSGPYRIVDPERDVVTQQKVVLTRDPRYWGAGVPGLPAAGSVDQLVYKVISNQDAAFIELTNGNLDVYALQPLAFKERSWSADFNRRFLKAVQYASGYVYIGWNNAHPLFGDRRVRQAMTHLADREGMVASLLFGLGETVESPIHKFRPEYDQDLQPYAYDPARAIALLEEAGWSDTDGDGALDRVIDGQRVPFEFEILVNAGNQIRKDVALVMQRELQEVGIRCQVRELDWSIFLQRVKGQDFAAAVNGWTGSLRFAPDAYQVWHSSQSGGRGSNYVGFRNAEVDRLLEEYRREFDLDRRIALYRRFQEILHEEQPYTFLWKPRTATAYSRRFRGVNWYPAGPEVQEWWVEPGERVYP
jgi:peptide/nickel transport system substrate-binding protein